MQNLFKILVGSLLGTLAVFYLLKLREGGGRLGLEQSRNAGLDSSGARAVELGPILEDTSQNIDELNEDGRRQLAIARLKAFLQAVRENRLPAH